MSAPITFQRFSALGGLRVTWEIMRGTERLGQIARSCNADGTTEYQLWFHKASRLSGGTFETLKLAKEVAERELAGVSAIPQVRCEGCRQIKSEDEMDRRYGPRLCVPCQRILLMNAAARRTP